MSGEYDELGETRNANKKFIIKYQMMWQHKRSRRRWEKNTVRRYC